jgi:transposase
MAKVIGHKAFVFLADCKAAAIATRGSIAQMGGLYCFPLPLNGKNPSLLKQWVLDPPAASVDIRLPSQAEDELAVGQGFEVELGRLWLNPHNQQWMRWHERYLVVYSKNLATAQIQGLHQRLHKAEIALEKLVLKPGDDLELLNAKVESILQRHQVTEFFNVKTSAQTITQTRNVKRGRPAANPLTKQVIEIQLQLQFDRHTTAIAQSEKLAGWRLYVTNAPSDRLSLTQAVVYYRNQWLIERGFHRLKRGQLPALPIYFQNQDRIVGLMFLLTLALRVFTLIEFVVRLALQNSQQLLTGLYDGNPKRATSRPSAEQLLKAFDNLTLYILPNAVISVSSLSPLQRQILALLKLPESIYHLHLKPRKT